MSNQMLVIKFGDKITRTMKLGIGVSVAVPPKPARNLVIDRESLTKEIHFVGKAPYVGPDGYWYQWNNQLGAFENTGINASLGPDEYRRPIIEIRNKYDLPSVPLGNQIIALYLAKDEHKIYKYNETDNTYYVFGSDYEEIEALMGGNANG